MKSIHLAPGLSLPLDAVTQNFAEIARRGAGKTYTAQKVCEEMLAAGAQCVVLDPVGNWFSLRLLADGKTPSGFDLPIFGGLHGDVQLVPTAGRLVADLVVDRGVSVILDVSMFRKHDRKQFATEFAEQLFHRKKSARSAMHLFIEEAQVFVPQRVQTDEARMLGAFEDIIKLGRNFGIGASLITQRPQAVNKDALNQTECLIVLQTNGAQERKALKDWIVDQGMDVGDLVDSLPSLQRGEAWIWSPSWLRITKRVQIGKKRTFDGSATPEVGKSIEPKDLSPVDLAEITKAMADVEAKAKADDPKELRKRIVDLERKLIEANRDHPATIARDDKAIAAAARDAKREARAEWQPLVKERDATIRELHARLARIAKAAESIGAEIGKEMPKVSALPIPPAPEVRSHHVERVRPAARVAEMPRRSTSARADGSLGKGERNVLAVLAQYGQRNRSQLAMQSGYAPTVSTFRNILSKLRIQGLIEDMGDLFSINDAGIAALGPFDPLPTGDALIQHFVSKLDKGAGSMLRALVDAYPSAMTREQLGEASGYDPLVSTFRNCLSKLRVLGLISEPGGRVRASEAFFE